MVFGVVAGGLTGLGLAWALILALQLGGDLASLMPPMVITVDLVVAGAAIAAVALLALGAARLPTAPGAVSASWTSWRLLG